MAQNITSSQTSGFRKRTINFSTQASGELHTDLRARAGRSDGVSMSFPKVNYGINFMVGETQPTRRELDVAIQGDGFFEVQRNDGSKVYTRSGEFRMRADRTLVTTDGHQVLSDGGAPITFTSGAGAVTINRDGTVFQGENALGRLAVKKFANNAALQDQLRATGGGTTAEIGGTADVDAPLGAFIGITLFGSSATGGLNVTIGQAVGQEMNIGDTNLRTGGVLGIIQQNGSGVYSLDSTDRDAIQKITDAIQHVATQRASLGAAQSRLELASTTLSVEYENLSSAISRIRDVDVAEESTQFAKFSILVQSGTAMLAQANQTPKTVLQLLQG